MNKGRGLTCYQLDAGPGSPSVIEFDRMVNFPFVLFILLPQQDTFFSFPLFHIFYTVTKMLV